MARSKEFPWRREIFNLVVQGGFKYGHHLFKKDRQYTQISSAAVIIPEPADLPAEKNEQVEAMNKAIFGLSNIDKAIVALYLDDYPYQEIGEIMGISVNHVAVKMNRIKARLKEAGKKHLK